MPLSKETKINQISRHWNAIILNFKQFNQTHRQDPFRSYYSESEWTWEQWKLRGTPRSSKLHIWSFTIRLFNVISSTLVCGPSLTLQQRRSQFILHLHSCYRSVLSCVFPFKTKVVFGYFHGIVQRRNAQGVSALSIMILPNHCEYLPQHEHIQSNDIRSANWHVRKYWKTIDSP